MSDGYELLESLGAAHPSQVSVTVAEATARELRGIPLAISGDPVAVEDSVEREWLRNNPGQPSPFDPDDQALLALAALERQSTQLKAQPLRSDWIPVADRAVAPGVKTKAVAAPRTITAIPCGHYADGSPIRRHTYELVREPEPFGKGTSRLWGVCQSNKRNGIHRIAPLAVVWTESIEPAPLPSIDEARTSIWPAPSHHALTDSITALAASQRRLMIGGRLAVGR